MADTRVYSTDAIEVHWDASRCIHSARCIAGLPRVFDPRRRPWIVLEGAEADRVAEVISRCPSGALHFRRLDGGPQEQPDEPPVAVPVPNGPLYLRGELRIETADGELIAEDTRMALCRCGGSANKPFCDNTHMRTGFRG
ncbi:MAG TPA: (4Fe-4S)-binding protein [Dehalococcoidia bacterium]|jgi:uncharacterized Fe-S cluster protein YjdI